MKIGSEMARSKSGRKNENKDLKSSSTTQPDPLFDRLVELDRLEELLEELNELHITTVVELEARIHELEADIDDAPEADDDGSV